MLRGVAIALLVVALLAEGTTPEARLRKAVQLHQAGDMEGAAAEYRAFLESDPRNVEARSNLGAVLVRLGRYTDAIEQYRTALNVAPSNRAVRLNLALAYFKASELTAAVGEFQRLHKTEPGDLRVALLLADCHLGMGDNKAVIAVLEPFAVKDNRAVDYLLGTALLRDNQIERGQPIVDRIFRAGDTAESRLLIGTSKLMVKDFAGAREQLEKAVEKNPELPGVYPYYAMALLQTGDHDRALAAFHRGLEQDPNDFDCNLNYGALLKQDQRYDEAMPYLERALRVRPGNLAALYQIAGVQLATGKLDQSRVSLQKVIRESPEFIEGHVMLATVFYRLKRKEDGDRERATVERLTAERQAQEPGAKQR
jgi:Tfp pilus assembly protein PilF